MDKKWKPIKGIIHETNLGDVVVCHNYYPSEFEIQTELYSRLQFICSGIDNHCQVRGEVTVYCDNLKMRIDLMVFKHNQAMCGIEIKKSHFNNALPQNKKQKIRYEMLSRIAQIPIFFCTGMDEVEGIVKKVERIIK